MEYSLADTVLDRMGISAAHGTGELLEQITEAMHRCCGYDSTRKQLWALKGMRTAPPGLEPEETWEYWIEHGASGTCYTMTLALDWLLRTKGFNTRMFGWRMEGENASVELQHMTNAVTFGNSEYIIETSVASPKPMPVPGIGGATFNKGGTILVNNSGEIRMISPRAGALGTKQYVLMNNDVPSSEVIRNYYMTLIVHPENQSKFFVARTRPDGSVYSILSGRYLIRDEYQLIADGNADSVTKTLFLKQNGYSDEHIGKLHVCGALE